VCGVKVTNLGAVRLSGVKVLDVDNGCVVPPQLAAGAHFICTATRSVMWVLSRLFSSPVSVQHHSIGVVLCSFVCNITFIDAMDFTVEPAAGSSPRKIGRLVAYL
jgi:hypothetical protein